jgi:hypothetical protein
MHTIQARTIQYIRDLHARELMRLGWYRQWVGDERFQVLRERKAKHTAFLNDLLRKRGLTPAWYSHFFYCAGHIFGWCTAFLPAKWAKWIEQTLEYWILIRYEKYFRKLQLNWNLRSMIEALQLSKLVHQEPGRDVLLLLEQYIVEEKQLLSVNSC